MPKNQYKVVQRKLTFSQRREEIIEAKTPKGAMIKFNKRFWEQLAVIEVYDLNNNLLYESKVS